MVCKSSLESCQGAHGFRATLLLLGILSDCWWMLLHCPKSAKKDVGTKWARCCPCWSLWLVFPKRWTVIWRGALIGRGETIPFQGKPTLCPRSDGCSNETVPFWLVLSHFLQFSTMPFEHSAAGGIFVSSSSSSWLLLDGAGGTARLPPVRQGAEVHLTHDLGEQLVHHGLALGWGLHEGAAPVLCQGLAFAGGHLPLVLQVYLVPHQHHRNLLVPGTKWQEEHEWRDDLTLSLVDRRVMDHNAYAIIKYIYFNLGSVKF